MNPTENKQDEINLLELLNVIWQKKVTIVVISFLFTCLAGAYSLTVKERWTSSAEIIQPKYSDLDNYLEIRKEYSRISESEFKPNDLVTYLFSRFNLLAYSIDKRKSFIESSSSYQENVKNVDEKNKKIILSEIINKDFNIVKPDPKKNPNLIGIRISFSAVTASEAKDSLEKFIIFLNQNVVSQDIDDFSVELKEKIKDLENEKSRIEIDLGTTKTVQLENLEKAYSIAGKAEIKEYSKTLLNDANQLLVIGNSKTTLSDDLNNNLYLFMLGEKYLKAQIDVANQSKLIYPLRYYQIDRKLKALNLLSERLVNVKAKAFSYLSSPDYPTKKDKPNRILILLIGSFLGGLFGCIIIILRVIFR